MNRRPGYVPERAHRRIVNGDPDWSLMNARRLHARRRRLERAAEIAAAVAVLFAVVAFLLA